jgi:polyhydroxyalkanoate synthase subunit PhaC
VPVAAKTFRQFAKDFFQKNGFINGGVKRGDYEVSLKDLTCAILNIDTLQAHLVPPDASRALKALTSSTDYSERAFPGDHIGRYVSGKAQKEVTPAIGKWLNERSVA